MRDRLKGLSNRTIAVIVAGLLTAAGVLFATAASGAGSAPDCRAGELDSNGGFDIHCVVPIPAPSTVTITTPVPSASPSPVPTTVTSTVTVTRTVTASVTPSPSLPPSPSPSVSPSVSPTPTPTVSPTGGLTNCFTRLAQCGYPHLGNTGVPDGTPLVDYAGPTTITQAGAVIDGRRLPCLVIRATGVVIRNSVITCQGWWGIEVQSGNVTVEDTDVDCVNNRGTGMVFSNYTARRVHVLRCENGFHAGSNVTVVDSLISDVVEVGGGHGDGIQASSGSNIVIRHNTFDLRNPITSSIIMANLTMTNMTVEDNFFAAGAYTVYCPAGSGIVYRNNRFYAPVGNWPSDTHRPAYGFNTGCGHGGITWTGNYRDDSLAAIGAG